MRIFSIIIIRKKIRVLSSLYLPSCLPLFLTRGGKKTSKTCSIVLFVEANWTEWFVFLGIRRRVRRGCCGVLCCVIEFFFEIEFFWREDGVAISASLSEEEEG